MNAMVSVCNIGYEGPLCSVCSSGYAPFGSGEFVVCQVCKGSAIASIVAYSVTIIVALLIIIFLSFRPSSDVSTSPQGGLIPRCSISCLLSTVLSWADKAMPFIKTTISYFQVVGGLSLAFNITFPPIYTKVIALLNGIVTIDVISLMPLGCVVSTNHDSAMVLYTLVPLLFGVFMMMICGILEKAGKLVVVQNRIFSGVLLMTFIILPTISVKIFSTFGCTQFDDGYGSYLAVDLSIDCNSNQHKLYELFAYAMILVYPIGVPLTYFYLLNQQRQSIDPGQDRFSISERSVKEGLEEALKRRAVLQESNPKVRRLKFLYNSYEPRCWWFEVFETIRRLFLTDDLVFYKRGTAGQIVISMIMCVFAMRVYSGYKPFISDLSDVYSEVVQ